MSVQIKQLTASVAKLASPGQKNTENDDPNKNRGRCGDRIVKQMTKLCNMGEYCSTHGFHPDGPNHNSITCQFKKRNNHLNSQTYWPKAIRVAIEQQNHPTWKVKEKPN